MREEHCTSAKYPEILEDVSPVFDGSAVKHILEKAVEIAEEVKATSEWHRRMTHEGLNQKGQRYNLDHFVDGAKVYFYRPPSVLDVESETHRSLCWAGDHHQEDRQPLFPNLLS